MRTEASFAESRDGDASAIIGGYVYQVELTIARWLDLQTGQILELERGEDIALAFKFLTATGEKEQLLLEQIKKRMRPLTLRRPEALTTIVHFFEHRKINPSLELLFRYTTNARYGCEKHLPESLKPSAIQAWEQLRKGQLDGSARHGVIEGLRTFLSGKVAKPKEIDVKTWLDFQTYIKEIGVEPLRAFVQAFEWRTGTDDTSTLRNNLQQRLITEGHVLNDIQAEELYYRLFFYVFQVISQGRDVIKQLTIEDRATQLSHSRPSLSETDRTLLNTIMWKISSLEQDVHGLKEDVKMLQQWRETQVQIAGEAVEHRSWPYLLTVCKEQRRRILSYYTHAGKYDSACYIQRRIEQKITTWYRQAVTNLHRSPGDPNRKEVRAQILALVDQAGSGKTSVVLHLSEVYGREGPVIVIPGRRTVVDDDSLAREVLKAVEYPVNRPSHYASVRELCQTAHHQGYPLLIVIDGINENRDPRLMRDTLVNLLTECQDYPLLVLLTCRDAFWPMVNSMLEQFCPPDYSQDMVNGALPLGKYDDDELQLAREKYFTLWNVAAMLSVEAAHHLRLPLLLRVFSEVYQNGPVQFVPAIVDKELWQKYWDTKIEAIREEMEQKLSARAIGKVIKDIAFRMLVLDNPQLSLTDLADISPHVNPDDTSPQSLLLQLKNAAILQEDLSETVSFVHEPFLEFVLGKVLAQALEHPTQLENALAQIETLACGYRWRQVPLYVVELTSEPEMVIEWLRASNPWLAAQALKRVQRVVSLKMRQGITADMIQRLDSRFSLDRRRAAEILGLLGATESKHAVLRCWSRDRSQEALRALARFEVEEVIEPLITYLGRFLKWYFPDDQKLVDALPVVFRQHLIERAISLLNDPEHMFAAAHTLGFARTPHAVTPLLTHLKACEWCDWVAMVALLQIGTQEAFDALEIAIEGAAGQALLFEQQQEDARKASNQEQITNDAYLALESLRMYGFQKNSSKQVVSFLRHLLTHPNYYVRSEAIRSLARLGATETAPGIIMSAHVGEDRGVISDALRAFGSQLPVEPFLLLVGDSSAPDTIMLYVIEALGMSGNPLALKPLAEFITNRHLIKNHNILWMTIQALGNISHPETVLILAPLLEANDIDLNTLNFVVEALGHLHQPSAFSPLEHFIRTNWPPMWYSTIGSLVAAGGEAAIPLLREIWDATPDKRKVVLSCLLWINTREATAAILELLQPLDTENVALLAHALWIGRELPFITSTSPIGPVDDQLVAILENNMDTLPTNSLHHALWALSSIATPAALGVLERIATEPIYQEPLPPATLGSFQTLRDAAIHLLWNLGSGVVIEDVLDTVMELPVQVIAFRLEKMNPKLVAAALQHRLTRANDLVLPRLLTLLGLFGNPTVLSDVRTYIDDQRKEVANAAYEAEQSILGLADLW